MLSTKEQIQEIKGVLSLGRMSTYDAVTGVNGEIDPAALNLYIWNAQISGAFLTPLHICEVILRNAVSDALTTIYGANWPWSTSFEQSLPNPRSGYNPRIDLFHARQKFHIGQTGRVIPELKFVFWQRMFTGRHDARIWNNHLLAVLPLVDSSKSVATLRSSLFNDLEAVRLLRNRIAHHEPIFKRNLSDDFNLIVRVTEYRSKAAAAWMMHHQQVQALLKLKP